MLQLAFLNEPTRPLFVLFKHKFYKKNSRFQQNLNSIDKVEGIHADHLTTTGQFGYLISYQTGTSAKMPNCASSGKNVYISCHNRFHPLPTVSLFKTSNSGNQFRQKTLTDDSKTEKFRFRMTWHKWTIAKLITGQALEGKPDSFKVHFKVLNVCFNFFHYCSERYKRMDL